MTFDPGGIPSKVNPDGGEMGKGQKPKYFPPMTQEERDELDELARSN